MRGSLARGLRGGAAPRASVAGLHRGARARPPCFVPRCHATSRTRRCDNMFLTRPERLEKLTCFLLAGSPGWLVRRAPVCTAAKPAGARTCRLGCCCSTCVTSAAWCASASATLATAGGRGGQLLWAPSSGWAPPASVVSAAPAGTAQRARGEPRAAPAAALAARASSPSAPPDEASPGAEPAADSAAQRGGAVAAAMRTRDHAARSSAQEARARPDGVKH
jgi:hypothetical protein